MNQSDCHYSTNGIKEPYNSSKFRKVFFSVLFIICLPNLFAFKGYSNSSIILHMVTAEDNLVFQKNEIKGAVTDSNGIPLPGTSVIIKNTTTGTSTDFDGNYTIVAKESDILVFSYIGYISKEVTVGNKSTINVTLVEDSQALDEVVIVGYGSVKKSDLTGSVSSIKSEDLNKVPVLSAAQAIQGRAAGVLVSNGQNQPGGQTTIRIRGNNSMVGDNEPLYVVDGFIGGDINSVDPSDIAGIEVLKDASSTSIYGARGANGVIIVTTKSGKKGKPVIKFDSYYGLQQLANKIDLMDAREYAIYQNQRAIANGALISEITEDQLANIPSTDWQDATSRLAPMQNYNLSASGGGENMNYYISGNYISQDGIIEETGYNRYNLRVNLEGKLTEKLKMSTRIGVSRIFRTRDFTEDDAENERHPLSNLVRLAPTVSPYDSLGNLVPVVIGDNEQPLYANPIYNLRNIENNSVTHVINGNLYADYAILDNLSFRSTFGFQFQNPKENYYKPSHVFEWSTGYQSNARVQTDQTEMWINENYLKYNLKSGSHKLDFLLGTTVQSFSRERTITEVYDFATDVFGYHNLGAGDLSTVQLASDLQEWQRLSAYGRLQYNFNSKWLFTFNGRYDGSSRFGSNNKWGFFPSGAIAWRAIEEDFIQNLSVFDDLKFRVSYGISGSEALPPFSSSGQYDASTSSSYVLGGQQVIGFIPTRYANPNLSWESTAQFDFGIDASFFKGRINLVMDYFEKHTNDLFLNKPVPRTNGVNSIRENIGELTNKGYEFYLDGVILDKNDWKWNVGVNYSRILSTVEDLGGQDNILLGNVQGTLKTGFMQILSVGEQLGSFYGYVTDGVWQEDEVANGYTQFGRSVNPGDIKFVDQLTIDSDGDGIIDSSDGDINAEDRKIIGQAQPKFFGGVNSTISYKNLDLSVFTIFSVGSNVLNATRQYTMNTNTRHNKLREVLDYWTPENTDTDVPSITYARPNVIMDNMIEDASFLKVREITLSYRFANPVISKMNIGSLRVYGQVVNPFWFTNYTGYDPEVNVYGGNIEKINTDNGGYPSAITFTLGLGVTF